MTVLKRTAAALAHISQTFSRLTAVAESPRSGLTRSTYLPTFGYVLVVGVPSSVDHFSSLRRDSRD